MQVYYSRCPCSPISIHAHHPACPAGALLLFIPLAIFFLLIVRSTLRVCGRVHLCLHRGGCNVLTGLRKELQVPDNLGCGFAFRADLQSGSGGGSPQCTVDLRGGGDPHHRRHRHHSKHERGICNATSTHCRPHPPAVGHTHPPALGHTHPMKATPTCCRPHPPTAAHFTHYFCDPPPSDGVKEVCG